MKKLLSLLLALLMVFALAACGGNGGGNEGGEGGGDDVIQADLVLITDAKSVDDKGFNQYSWEGVVQYSEETGISRNYYMPTEQTTEQYMAQIATAVKGGAKVIVCPGFLFQAAVYDAQELYPDVKFICIDFAPTTEDYSDSKVATNSVAVLFEEEESGFLAGYAAVKEGFRSLGFDGAMAVPAVKNFGYGYLAGAEYAAKELGLAPGEVTVKYSYTGEFAEKPEYVTADQGWYTDGVEVIFGCGSPRNSFEAADKFNATSDHVVWAIGVDTDCSDQSEYVITSAMKNLAPVVHMLVKSAYETDFPEGGNTNYYNIKDDASALPMASSKFQNFTQADYDAIVNLLKTDEAFRTSLPTGYGNGQPNDFVNAADFAATLELVTVDVVKE
ncbi:MAG: BMP family ABC transporter substrate-binding protein [Erysipelotrichaceae bacterium]|nr:BMP family ABC transporter substrate-binding protein [Erysipelotrichaceae bacterium]